MTIMKGTCAILMVTFSFVAFGQIDQWKDVYSEKAWKERDGWQRPEELISRLKITAGSKVGDIGCHQGYMSFKLATIVGVRGKVFAVDVEQDKLNKLSAHTDADKIANIIAVKGDYDNPHLPDGALDAAIILDTYHEMDDHDVILLRVKAALKPGGRLLLCEPIAETRRGKSRSEQGARHELEMNFAIEDLRRAGFNVVEQIDRFIDREKIKGDKMWIVLATKPSM
jgi:ubiquinone/menaquinone biosynthesis C-methylase UbiE